MTASQNATRSNRLIFAYDKLGIRLVGTTPRTKAPPRGEDPHLPPPRDVVTLELRAPNGSVRFRTLLPDPIPQTVEIFDDSGRPYRKPNNAIRGAFSAVVPLSDSPTSIFIDAGAEVDLGLAPFKIPVAVLGRRQLAAIAIGHR